jgi:soluble lytic murein transglycosylase-like protein
MALIVVNPSGKGYHFKNKIEAVKFVKAQLASGKSSVDVGCMQINLKYHPDAFTSIEQVFCPRKNIAYGAKFLKEKYNQYGDWQKAIGSYHSGVKQINDSMHMHKKKLADLSSYRHKTTKITTRIKNPEQKEKFLGIGKV